MRFFLIDRIIEWHVGSTAEAVKNVALSEDFFDDHFPRRPIVPGVLLLERRGARLAERGRQPQHPRQTAGGVPTVLCAVA